VDDRENFSLTAGITIVLLYESGEFYLRVLHRHAKPKATYLTRHIPVSLEVIRRLAKREAQDLTWESDGYGIRTLTN